MDDPFSGPGQCIECGDFDDLHSGLCEICIEKRDLEAWERELEEDLSDFPDVESEAGL